MTIRRNPNRGNQEERDAFVGQSASEDTTRLHCYIPSPLHYQLKMMAHQHDGASDRGFENFVGEHQRWDSRRPLYVQMSRWHFGAPT